MNPHEIAVTSASTGRGLRSKTEYKWRLRCVLSVSCIKTLPLIYRYCKFAFWSIFFHSLCVTSASTGRGLRFKTEYQWRLHCVLSVSCIKTLPLIYRYCKFAFWSTFFHSLCVCNHFQNVQYSTTQAIQALAQTGLAIQSHKVRQRTSRSPGHHSRTHQEGKCCVSVHLHETYIFNSIQASLVIRDLTLRVFAITRFRGKKSREKIVQ